MNYQPEFLKSMFQMMVRIRTFEDSLLEPILSRKIYTPCHLCSGQEAVAVGVCMALTHDDYVFGNHRSHGHYLAKGGSLKDIAAEIYCRESGCSRGRGGSMHLIAKDVGMMGSAPIVAGTISLAVGAALASTIRNDGRVTTSFFGDGATGEGVLYESLNFAALKNLPIIFACENNLYATHMPIRECRVNQSIHKIAEPFGIDNYEVDGNDVMEVYNTSQKAVETCRKGNGPVFIEFMTYRYRGHVGPDDNIQGTHTDIRPPEELAKWLANDPIKRFEKYLLEQNVISEKDLQAVKHKIEKEVEEARIYAVNSPSPKPEGVSNYVFA